MSDREKLSHQRRVRQAAKERPPFSFHVSSGGLRTIGTTTPGNPAGLGGGKRSTVHTFSKASQRRFRESLLLNQPPEECRTYDVTFTFPGRIENLPACKDAFRRWSRRVSYRGWLAHWRAEVQPERKRRYGDCGLHFHAVVSVPESECRPRGESMGDTVEAEWGALIVRRSWWEAVESMGPALDYSGREWSSRMAMSGASERAALVEHDGSHGRGSWKRYLREHTSKAKRDQIGEDIGRHWGIINRKGYVPAVEDMHNVRCLQYFAGLRVVQKLYRRRVEAGCVFGAKHGRRQRRGRIGQAVWFCYGGASRPVGEGGTPTAEAVALWASGKYQSKGRLPDESALFGDAS